MKLKIVLPAMLLLLFQSLYNIDFRGLFISQLPQILYNRHLGGK